MIKKWIKTKKNPYKSLLRQYHQSKKRKQKKNTNLFYLGNFKWNWIFFVWFKITTIQKIKNIKTYFFFKELLNKLEKWAIFYIYLNHTNNWTKKIHLSSFVHDYICDFM